LGAGLKKYRNQVFIVLTTAVDPDPAFQGNPDPDTYPDPQHWFWLNIMQAKYFIHSPVADPGD
jgi:hypothetical protein